MADITNEIAAIQIATTGSAIRSAIINALSVLNDNMPVWYSGAYSIAPSTSSIIVSVSGLAMARDLIVEAFPQASYYSGSYIIAPSTVSLSFPTSGYLMSSDLIIESYSIPQPNLISKSVSENGIYNAQDDNADGYSEVTVNVVDANPYELIEEWDFTGSDPLIGTIHSMSAEMSGIIFGENGAIFDNASKYIAFPSALASNTGVIEIEVNSMSIVQNGNHHRFLMAGSYGLGFIFRSTGYWGLYNGSWYMTQNSNRSLFDNSIVDIVINDNNAWQIYKDGTIIMSASTGTILPLGSSKIRLGEMYDQSFMNAVISKIRFYSMSHISFPLH